MKMNLTIESMTPHEALHVVKAAAELTAASDKAQDAPNVADLLNKTPLAKMPFVETGRTPSAAPAPEPAPAPSKPLIDKDKIAGIAAANPAKAPKPEKPAAKPRGKKPVDDADMSDEEVDALPTSDVITPAMKEALKSKPATKAKPAPHEPDEDEEEMEENEHGVLQPKGHMEKVYAKHGKDPEPEGDDEEEEAPKPKAKAPAAKPAVAKELLEARKLRDVLAYLMDKESLTDHDELKARCAAIKESVPCLQRITDLDSRIDRTLEVMDMGDDLS